MSINLGYFAAMISLFLAFSSWAFGQAMPQLPNSSTADFAKYSDSMMQVLPPDSPAYFEDQDTIPFVLKAITQWGPKVSPTGERQVLGDCDPFPLERQAQQLKNPTQYKNFLIEKSKNCDLVWANGARSTFMNVIDAVRLDYQFYGHPFGRHVLFNLPTDRPKQVRLKGFLLLKPGAEKRPLVIYRAGVFSTTHQAVAERFIIMQFFDSMPYHLLMLESTSGDEFMRRNGPVALAGLEEGLQNYFIASYLQTKSTVAEKVSQVFLTGISMGGHGLLWSYLLNDWALKPKISSFVALCPLVQLEASLAFHSRQFYFPIVNHWSAHRLDTLLKTWPDLTKDNFIPASLDRLSQSYTSPLLKMNWSEFDTPVNFQEQMKAKDNLFWRLSDAKDFWSSLKKNSPLLVLSTEQDPLVPFDINAAVFRDQMQKSPATVFLQASQGIHCSLSASYDYQSLRFLFQSFLWRSENPKVSREKVWGDFVPKSEFEKNMLSRWVLSQPVQ